MKHSAYGWVGSVFMSQLHLVTSCWFLEVALHYWGQAKHSVMTAALFTSGNHLCSVTILPGIVLNLWLLSRQWKSTA